MRDHDGIVELDSEPGRGSTVRCLFPAIETESADAPETAAQLVRGNGERVLYVDDESTLAEVGDRRLTALGYVVTAVTDSVLALEIFKSKPEQFDLVVTDYYMPKLSGLELASRLTALRPDIPIVLMTGFSGQIAPEGLEASGIKMIVPKPVTTRQLSHALRDLLADRPAS
jgi:CheY-like chemotaxis protein